MTVRIHTTLPGINQEQFDAMNKLIMANEPPNGLLFHSSAPIEGGWQVIDFWESRQAYDRGHARGSEGDRIGRCDSSRTPERRGVRRPRDVPALIT